jgi:hypothetical protein
VYQGIGGSGLERALASLATGSESLKACPYQIVLAGLDQTWGLFKGLTGVRRILGPTVPGPREEDQVPQRSCVAFVLVTAAMLAGGCAETLDPLLVSSAERRITVTNTSDEEWRDIEVWVNHHYRAVAASLGPKGRMTAPLGSFVAGFGQRFDPAKQTVVGVEVTATTASGKPVKLTWGEGRKR